MQIEYLKEEFNPAQKHCFGTSREKKKVNISQETIYQLGFVFNGSEAYADAVIRKELGGETTAKEHKRKKMQLIRMICRKISKLRSSTKIHPKKNASVIIAAVK